MEALQYIYTSWRNGDSVEKGYMIYSRSRGITDADCAVIKDAMQYLPPKELSMTPTPEEITETFPYSFAYFPLPSGRSCVAQSTYLGRDYSGRFGNYIIYALVFERDRLLCRPAELFGEEYIKTYMTREELDAPSPVPPLPPLRIERYGSVINDDQINDFLFEKEDEFAMVIEMMLEARRRRLPFYINDTRENLVLWAASLQRMLPERLAGNFYFNTYVGNHEFLQSPRARAEGLDFLLIGVRPDANYFNYAAECRSNRHIVIDFLGGNMTEGIEVGSYAAAMAASMAMDYEDTDSFNQFLDTTSLAVIDCQLETAFLYYRLLKYGEFSYRSEEIGAVLHFGQGYCEEEDNEKLAAALLLHIQEKGLTLPLEVLRELWSFVCRYAEFMALTLYDTIRANCYQAACRADTGSEVLLQFMRELKKASPKHYKGYKENVGKAENVNQLMLDLSGHQDYEVNRFYIEWILSEYQFNDGLTDKQPIAALLRQLLINLCQIDGSEKLMIHILLSVCGSNVLFDDVLQIFTDTMTEALSLEPLCSEYLKLTEDMDPETVSQFEKRLLASPEGMALASHLCARRILAAKRPAEEFFSFYEQQRALLEQPEKKVTIAPMVTACLDSLDGEEREQAAAEMVMKLSPVVLKDRDTIGVICAALEAMSMKEMLRLDSAVLRQACRMYTYSGKDGLLKIPAVLLGQKIQDSAARGIRLTYANEIDRVNISLASLGRSDYEQYCKAFLQDYILLIYSVRDLQSFLQIFYNTGGYEGTLKEYISIVKHMEKKNPDRWKAILILTASCLAQEEPVKPQPKEFRLHFIRYIRSLDEDMQKLIREGMEKEVSEEKNDIFWSELNQKEGLQERLGGLFKRGGK